MQTNQINPPSDPTNAVLLGDCISMMGSLPANSIDLILTDPPYLVRYQDILGTSEQCIATNPSDMCVAMAALEATIHVQGLKDSRAIPIGDFHLLPGNTPNRETVLEPDELITHVTLPPPIVGSKQVYLKLRDRASYEFALASAAVVIKVVAGNVTVAHVALGGVGTKPWRSREAEFALLGKPGNINNFRNAAEATMRNAKPQSENGFKIELAKRWLVHALQTATNG
jgi:xanthine dehydrogenase YagS FAD-binding subunit